MQLHLAFLMLAGLPYNKMLVTGIWAEIIKLLCELFLNQ